MQTHKHYHHVTSDYLILLLLLGTGFTALTRMAGQPEKQLIVGAITAVSYLCWGIYHHIHEHDLHWKIVVEYTTFALAALSILWLLLSMQL